MGDVATAIELASPAPLAFVEQSASMTQQLATARIQSSYMVALRMPRDIEKVRQDMLKECSRPSFCVPDESKNGSSIAIYRVPRAKTNIEGVTIRFAEMCARAYKNLSTQIFPLGEDDKTKMYQVVCVDYETNVSYDEIVSVPKSIERSYAKDTDVVLSQRTNSYGKPVYLIMGTDDDIAMKKNALISKATRNLIMKHIPGWLVEECIEKVRETARKKDAADPDAAKRKLYDAFASIGVTAAQLTEYLGHSNALSPAELEDLRGYYSAIKEGATTWRDIVAAKDEHGEDAQAQQEALDKLFEKLEMTPAQIRNMKAKYISRGAELLAYLQEQIGKQQDTGARPAAAESQPERKEQPQPSAEKQEAAPSPAARKQQDPPKPVNRKASAPPPPIEEEGW